MMKTKKGFKSLALLLALILAIGFSPASNVSAQTAPRLNYKKVTLVQGKKKRLKVKGTKRKVRWYSTKKSVVTVNKKGVIKAKKKGKATIVAKVGKKKLRCKVTVKKKPAKKKSSKKSTKKISKSVKKQLAWNPKIWKVDNMAINSKTDLFAFLVEASEDYSHLNTSMRTKYFKWYSSNSSVLSISRDGFATGKKIGSVTVYCKFMNAKGQWNKTNSVTVKVVDGGNVKFSYSLSTSKIPFDQDTYKVWDYYKHDTYDTAIPKFNAITVKIQNSSEKSIRLDNVTINTTTVPSEIYFENASQKSITIPAHGEITETFYASYAYSGSLNFRICKNYIIDKEVLSNISLHYQYGSTRLRATFDFNTKSWKTINQKYATKSEYYKDEDSVYH